MKKYLLLILFILIGFSFYSISSKIINSSKKIKRVECQAKTTTFEKIFVEKPILESIAKLKNGEYEIISKMEYSKHIKSHLINVLTKEKADEILSEVLKKYTTPLKNQNDKLIIDYYIYENDKEDINKKNEKTKPYAGYLMFDFKYKNEIVYKIKTKYKNSEVNQLKERMNCVVESFISIK